MVALWNLQRLHSIVSVHEAVVVVISIIVTFVKDALNVGAAKA